MAKKKIMIVDDEKDFLEITKLNLEKTGQYEIMTLPAAGDIIPILHEFKPDLILLDVLMPGIDGLMVCEMLNKDPLGIVTPIIIISALSDYRDQLKAYKLGIAEFLTKPVDKNTLIISIEKSLKCTRL